MFLNCFDIFFIGNSNHVTSASSHRRYCLLEFLNKPYDLIQATCLISFISYKWAATWDFKQCGTSISSDQPAHTRSLFRAFARRLNILWLLSYWLKSFLTISVVELCLYKKNGADPWWDAAGRTISSGSTSFSISPTWGTININELMTFVDLASQINVPICVFSEIALTVPSFWHNFPSIYLSDCVVYQYKPNGTKTLSPCRKSQGHCLYTGKSDSHNDSWVAANICNGLVSKHFIISSSVKCNSYHGRIQKVLSEGVQL